MKLNYLLTGLISSACLLLSAPAHASKFTGWEFDANRNQLNFGTDTGVQPKATLLDGPYRLVVDLPGTKMTEATVRKKFGAAVREVRIAQADDQNTRLVLELAPGYGVSPQNIIIRSDIPNRWLGVADRWPHGCGSRSPIVAIGFCNSHAAPLLVRTEPPAESARTRGR